MAEQLEQLAGEERLGNPGGAQQPLEAGQRTAQLGAERDRQVAGHGYRGGVGALSDGGKHQSPGCWLCAPKRAEPSL
jgi:hypothetical protein